MAAINFFKIFDYLRKYRLVIFYDKTDILPPFCQTQRLPDGHSGDSGEWASGRASVSASSATMADVMAGFENNMFGDDKLDSLVTKTFKEKYPNLPKEKQKELYEQVKAQILNVSGEIRGIPRYPKIGKLPDYEFHCKISIISMKVLGENRRIVGTERIQTEAGVFDCFILEETITTKSMMLKDVEKIGHGMRTA